MTRLPSGHAQDSHPDQRHAERRRDRSGEPRTRLLASQRGGQHEGHRRNIENRRPGTRAASTFNPQSRITANTPSSPHARLARAHLDLEVVSAVEVPAATHRVRTVKQGVADERQTPATAYGPERRRGKGRRLFCHARQTEIDSIPRDRVGEKHRDRCKRRTHGTVCGIVLDHPGLLLASHRAGARTGRLFSRRPPTIQPGRPTRGRSSGSTRSSPHPPRPPRQSLQPGVATPTPPTG